MLKKRKVKIAVFVSGGGTNLQALIDAQKSGSVSSGEICLVVSSNPEAYALVRAKMAGIPTEIIQKSNFSSQNDFENALVNKLNEYGIELIVLAGFMTILSEGFTSRYPERIINVHPSLIPAF